MAPLPSDLSMKSGHLQIPGIFDPECICLLRLSAFFWQAIQSPPTCPTFPFLRAYCASSVMPSTGGLIHSLDSSAMHAWISILVYITYPLRVEPYIADELVDP